MSERQIQRVVDQVLIEAMRPELRAALEAALDGGVDPDQLLRRVGEVTGGPDRTPGGLAYLQVAAYLARGRK